MKLSVELVILGGGAGKRLGRVRKSQIKIGGETIIEKQVRKLSSLFEGILYVTSPLEKDVEVPRGVRKVFDLEPGEGPLMGLITGLKSTLAQGVFLLACDMPFVKHDLVKAILSYAQKGYEVVTPLLDKGPEPLFSFYSKKVLPLAEEAYKKGERKLISFFPSVKLYYFKKSEVKSIDPEMISFFNINKPSDLEKAQELAKEYV